MKTTVLIKPNNKQNLYGKLEPLSAIEPPLWLALFANAFKNPILIDAEAERLSLLDIKNKVDSINPTEVIILATGSHPSAHIQQLEIAKLLANTLKQYDVKVYDYLPFDPTKYNSPRWDLLNMKLYRAHNWHCWGGLERNNYGVIYSSISCPYKCKFCTVKSFYRQSYKVRTPLEVVTDILSLHDNYGITNFKMMDELFLTKSTRTKDICNLLYKNGLRDKINIWAYSRIDTLDRETLELARKGGVRWLALGIESGNYEIRKKVSKGNFTNSNIKGLVDLIKEEGISVLGNYMFGFWDDNINTMTETLDLAMNLQTEYANFYCVTAYPNTELYSILEKKNIPLPKKGEDYAQLSKDFKPIRTQYLTGEEVLNFRDMAFKTYFNNLDYLHMMKHKFGENTMKEILEMNNIKVDR